MPVTIGKSSQFFTCCHHAYGSTCNNRSIVVRTNLLAEPLLNLSSGIPPHADHLLKKEIRKLSRGGGGNNWGGAVLVFWREPYTRKPSLAAYSMACSNSRSFSVELRTSPLMMPSSGLIGSTHFQATIRRLSAPSLRPVKRWLLRSSRHIMTCCNCNSQTIFNGQQPL